MSTTIETGIEPAEGQGKPPGMAGGSVDSNDRRGDAPEDAVDSRSEGLSESEAQRRLAEDGPNELPEKRVSVLRKLAGHFWAPIPWMIEAAALLSAFVGDWTDFAIILALLVANAAVGFWEEYQAGNAIAALKAGLALNARVKRDGSWRRVPAREVVRGDLVRLHLGEIIPADARLSAEGPLEVDQSALTGESLPVSRGQGEVVYSGSVVKRGEAEARVYATGTKTFFGKTAQLVESAHTVSHFQKAVLRIGDYLIFLAVALVIVIVGVALFRGDKLTTTLQFALVLTVAAIPVAMPTVLSVTMAVGARLLAAKQAIVSRLAAIEEMAGIDILCSDKTGTLTQNKLTLGEPAGIEGVTADEIIRCAALASREEDQDPIDLAVLGGVKDRALLKSARVTGFQPFDPVSKRTEATVTEAEGRSYRVSKGAPQVILALSDTAPEIQSRIERRIADFAARGFRSLGVARTEANGDWRFLGVMPLYDPPRDDSRETIQAAQSMGVKVKMVTGDQVVIAREIAGQLGLGTDIRNASALEGVQLHQSGQMGDEIESADGFAQVFPEHKYHIVETLQSRGHIVGMTGDGVNDAPALKKADAGIAVSGATDAARSAAAIVLLKPGLSVIVEAIQESRRIFRRMSVYATYRIAETIRVLLFMTLSILVFNFYPVTAVMIVLLALLNDGAIISIAYDRANYARKPATWNMQSVLGVATVLGIAGVIESFGLFYLAERVFQLNREMIQSLIYLKLSVAGHLTIFVTRTRGPFWKSRPAPVLLGAVLGTQCIATLIAVYGFLMAPIGWGYAGLVWAYALVGFLIEDGVKQVAYKVLDPEHPGMLGRMFSLARAGADESRA